jgi:hypothetical protein
MLGKTFAERSVAQDPEGPEKDWLEKLYHNHHSNFTTHHRKCLVALSPFLQIPPDAI